MEANDLIPFIEPIFRFCSRRLQNPQDAEDLASEIFCYALEGMNKYEIESPEAWVWRIAHNRYARFIDGRNRERMMLFSGECPDVADDPPDEEDFGERYQAVFHFLHTLSSEYRNIFVDYYLYDLSVRELARKYDLTESTVKWRLNIGRQKIKERIGECQMEKIYHRLNWNTTTCNGYMNADKYLHSQLARAICEAAYEKPLTVEEISLATGIPTIYIEDELVRLEFGDAISKIGNKYATNFIIFHRKDQEETEKASEKSVKAVADQFESLFADTKCRLDGISFYGRDFGIGRLGYILIPSLLRERIRKIRGELGMDFEPFSPRKDGGYGWFIVKETADAEEALSEFDTGANRYGKDAVTVDYFWIGRYFSNEVNCLLSKNPFSKDCVSGRLPDGFLTDEDAAHLIQNNLTVKDSGELRLNIPCFTKESFKAFLSTFRTDNAMTDRLIANWLTNVRKSFEEFVPKRLESQINQWISFYAGQLIGLVIEELIERGILEKPDAEKSLVNGICLVSED